MQADKNLSNVVILFYYLFIRRFYFFIHERQRDTHTHRQREKQAPCREPDVGLDPGTPGSRPGPKAGAKLPSHQGFLRGSYILGLGGYL